MDQSSFSLEMALCERPSRQPLVCEAVCEKMGFHCGAGKRAMMAKMTRRLWIKLK